MLALIVLAILAAVLFAEDLALTASQWTGGRGRSYTLLALTVRSYTKAAGYKCLLQFLSVLSLVQCARSVSSAWLGARRFAFPVPLAWCVPFPTDRRYRYKPKNGNGV